jgi:hypothetical protein
VDDGIRSNIRGGLDFTKADRLERPYGRAAPVPAVSLPGSGHLAKSMLFFPGKAVMQGFIVEKRLSSVIISRDQAHDICTVASKKAHHHGMSIRESPQLSRVP